MLLVFPFYAYTDLRRYIKPCRQAYRQVQVKSLESHLIWTLPAARAKKIFTLLAIKQQSADTMPLTLALFQGYCFQSALSNYSAIRLPVASGASLDSEILSSASSRLRS
jgi:hypothetical protein